MFYTFGPTPTNFSEVHLVTQSNMPLPCCHVIRPYYLQDLVDEPFEQDDTLGLLVRETIGGEYYSGPDNYVVNMTVGEVQQWHLQGSEGHPFHLHVNHVQYMNVDGPSLVPGWNQVGDWVDTVSSEYWKEIGYCMLGYIHVDDYKDIRVEALLH